MSDNSKPSVKVYFEETERHYVRHEAIIINEDTHPELKGMSQEEMVAYVKENMERMKPTSEYSSDLMEQAATSEEDWDKYIEDGSDYVVEAYSPDEDDENDEDDED